MMNEKFNQSVSWSFAAKYWHGAVWLSLIVGGNGMGDFEGVHCGRGNERTESNGLKFKASQPLTD